MYLIKGYCTWRSEERTFNANYIDKLINLQTGEVFDRGLDFWSPYYHTYNNKRQKRKFLILKSWLIKKRRQSGISKLIQNIRFQILVWRGRAYKDDY